MGAGITLLAIPAVVRQRRPQGRGLPPRPEGGLPREPDIYANVAS